MISDTEDWSNDVQPDLWICHSVYQSDVVYMHYHSKVWGE